MLVLFYFFQLKCFLISSGSFDCVRDGSKLTKSKFLLGLVNVSKLLATTNIFD